MMWKSCWWFLISSGMLFPAETFSPSVSLVRLQEVRIRRIRQHCPPFRTCTRRRDTSELTSAAVDHADNTTSVSWEEVVVPVEETPPHHHRMTIQDKFLMATTAVAAIALFSRLVHWSGPGAWRYYVAGGICAAVSHAIPVPIDVVKTRKQVDPELADTNFVKAIRRIWRKEGFRALLAGLGPTVFGYLIEGSVKFGVYEAAKPAVARRLASVGAMSSRLAFVSSSQILAFLICGTISGLAASVVVCPMEAIRIRMVSEPDFAPQGWVQGGFQMLQQEGFWAVWKGMLPMLYKQVPYTVTKNVSFDLITRTIYNTLRQNGYVMTHFVKVAVPFLAALVASVLSCISSHPGDVLLSLVNAHEGNRGTHEIAHDILRSERGVRGFFVGIKTRFLHVGIIVTLQLLIYDFVKRLCGIAATGSV